MDSKVEEALLKTELVGLFGHISRMRRELASLQAPDDNGDFASMADTLDAIVENTEAASNIILESAEDIEAVLDELRARKDPAINALCDRIGSRANTIFEACSFQDLTGQRITRLVKGIKFIEERVNAMVRMWGRDEVAKVVDEVRKQAKPGDPDKALLHGPQRQTVAFSQDDVDKLFSQDDIDKLFG